MMLISVMDSFMSLGGNKTGHNGFLSFYNLPKG